MAATIIRLSTDASHNLTGLTGGSSGSTLFLHNVGSFNLVMKNESILSIAANRFALTADVTLTPNSLALLQYDSTSSRWRCLSVGSGGGLLPSGTQGDVLYYNGTSWVSLGASTAGRYLRTAGLLANPTWADMGGDVTGTPDVSVVAKINGATLGTTTATSGNVLIGDGTQWVTHAISGDATISSTGVVTLATVPIAKGGTGQTTAIAAHDALSTQSTPIASAATTDLSTATGYYAHITGTTTITAFGTCAAGVQRSLVFDGALTLTHNATSLILPTGANITTAAGDCAVMESEGGGNWRCVSYTRKSGQALVGNAGSVTSVGLSTDASWLTVGSSPVTSAGTITINKTTGLAANSFLATPDGSTGALTLRSITLSDLPGISGDAHPYGLALSNPSTTTITVGTGKVVDSTLTKTITLAVATTLSTSTLGAINGLDQGSISGTVATTSGSRTITGTGTSFKTMDGPLNFTGTATTSGTAVTGTGTLFLSEANIGDVFGNATYGYSRIVAIASDTSMTLIASLPGGDIAIAATVGRMKNMVFQPGSQTAGRVDTITNDTTLLMESAWSTATTASGLAGNIGALCGTTAANVFYYIWLTTGGSGTGLLASTRNDFPRVITGYTTSYRRIGVFAWTGTQIVEFSCVGKDNNRTYTYEIAINSKNSRMTSAGTSTAWADSLGSSIAPPTARTLILDIQQSAPTNITGVYARKRNAGNSATSRPLSTTTAAAGGYASGQFTVNCDGAQAIQYVNTAASGATYIDCIGFIEDLNP